MNDKAYGRVSTTEHDLTKRWIRKSPRLKEDVDIETLEKLSWTKTIDYVGARSLLAGPKSPHVQSAVVCTGNEVLAVFPIPRGFSAEISGVFP